MKHIYEIYLYILGSESVARNAIWRLFGEMPKSKFSLRVY